MSGRYEKEMNFERKIKEKLHDAPPILEEYYYSLIGAGKSYSTAHNYVNNVLLFADFTFKNRYSDNFYEKVTSSHINKYIASLRTKNVDGTTKRTSDSFRSVAWSSLNSFFQFLVPQYLSKNPVADTTRPKMKDNPKVTYLTSDEITRLLQHVELYASERFKNRDLCILKLGFSTGLRVSAISQIDVDDIDFVNNQIKVTEKGDYDDYIMFGENLKKQLLSWVADREKYYGHLDSKALFISRNNSRIDIDTVNAMIKKYAAAVTDKRVTAHVMRHSCATNLYEKTGDIYLCSKQLRHKNVTTTQRYAEISNEKQKMAVNTLDNLI